MSTALHELEDVVKARRALPPPVIRRALREAAGASLADVARACNVSRKAVSMWEAGIFEPRAANLIAYERVLAMFRSA